MFDLRLWSSVNRGWTDMPCECGCMLDVWSFVIHVLPYFLSCDSMMVLPLTVAIMKCKAAVPDAVGKILEAFAHS